MKNSNIVVLFIIFFAIMSCNTQTIFIPKLTNINPVSYTAVTYAGSKDTAFVATFSGRISKRINGNPKETIVARIMDEIYSLAYNPKRKEIVASTLENGLLIINEKNGKIIKKLSLKTTWSVAVFYSDNLNYLITQDQKGNQYIWDVTKNYQEYTFADGFPKGMIVKIDKQNTATIINSNSIFYWDMNNDKLQKEIDVKINKFADMDGKGNFLSLNYNECTKYNSNTHKPEFKMKHPNWITHDIENENKVYEDPYSMTLTMAKFANNEIYTASIDRSIRVWNKETGELLKTLTYHKATVNELKVSKDESQIVSVDLKGGIKFWDIE